MLFMKKKKTSFATFNKKSLYFFFMVYVVERWQNRYTALPRALFISLRRQSSKELLYISLDVDEREFLAKKAAAAVRLCVSSLHTLHALGKRGKGGIDPNCGLYAIFSPKAHKSLVNSPLGDHAPHHHTIYHIRSFHVQWNSGSRACLRHSRAFYTHFPPV